MTAPRAKAPAKRAGGAKSAQAAALSDLTARLQGSLTRYKREELDAEARRLGITIQAGWNKPNVVEAIQGVYDAHPVGE